LVLHCAVALRHVEALDGFDEGTFSLSTSPRVTLAAIGSLDRCDAGRRIEHTEHHKR
jgi:hypothetical protein